MLGPSFNAEDNSYFLSRKIAHVNQIIGSDTIHPKRVSHYGLNSALLGQNDMPAITRKEAVEKRVKGCTKVC